MDTTTALPILWFGLIAALWACYFVLEGFDFGVGMLLRPVARDDTERRLMINTFAPVWEGNQVWLIFTIGAMFAAFPEWYATMLSGFYLPVLLIIAALIVRGVAFEFRGKINQDNWRAQCDVAITIGSWVPALAWGLILANLARGVELNADYQMTSSLPDLLSPYALAGAATFVLLLLTHGATYLALRTGDEFRIRARTLAGRLGWVSASVGVLFAIITQLAYAAQVWTWVAVVLVGVGASGVPLALRRAREGWAFVASTVTIVAMVALIFGGMFDDVVPALNEGGTSLSISTAAASPAALTVLTWISAILVPGSR